MTDNERLDQICQLIHTAETLNALHSCRTNHPLNNKYQWRNANAMVSQQPWFFGKLEARNWLNQKAIEEANANG